MASALSPAGAPLRIEVTRGDLVESWHTGDAAVVDAAGRVLAAWGGIDVPVFARSAIKPLQALPLVETGAAERYGLGDAELSIACGSHNGEPEHARLVQGWLERIGLSVADLACGAHPPYYEPAAQALLRAGQAPDACHNNCSGKHTGMLTHTVHLGEPTRGYLAPDHPTQRRVRAVLSEMTRVDLERAPRGTDGCGLPQYGLPLRALAHGMACLAAPDALPAERRSAALRLRAAMAAAPFFLAGSGRFCTDLITATAGRVLVKSGAEGVYAAILPEQGLGVAMKIHDGGVRPRAVAFGAILRRLGALDDAAWNTLAPHVAPVLRNVAGTEVGRVRVGPGWLDAIPPARP